MPGIMERLKSETQDLHDAAETHGHQTALVKGDLPLERYIAHLEQHLMLHRALENALRAHSSAHPAFDAVITAEQFQEPYLEEDLRHFGCDPQTVTSTPETQEVVEDIERAAAEQPIKLLGFHYVMEGSNNGNRFIAMKIREAYNLSDGKGLKYLDPYGQNQRPLWMKFKQDMADQQFTPQEEDLLVEGAKEMFKGVGRISDGLLTAGSPA